MKIVVTGGLGYLGSALAWKILERFPEASVVILDNRSASHSISPEIFFQEKRLCVIEGDILTSDLAKIFKNANIVVHLAALSSPSESFKYPQETMRVNFAGTCKIADACIRTGASLWFPSTTSVYGIQNGVASEVCGEDYLKPQSPYAESKLRAEFFLRTFVEQRRLRFSIVRFGTVFGFSPGMRFNTAVNKFCFQAVTDEPLTVWASALNQVRPYLHIDDAVEAILFLVAHSLFEGEIYNVATFSTRLVEIIENIRLVKPSVRIEKVNSPAMNHYSYEADTHKLLNEGFLYKGTLQQSISQLMLQLSVMQPENILGNY